MYLQECDGEGEADNGTASSSGSLDDNGTASSSGSLERQVLEGKELMPGVVSTILSCRRASSNRLYSGYILKWQAYCKRSGINPLAPSVANLLNFLQELREEPDTHRGYSAICTARATVGSVIVLNDKNEILEDPHIKLYIKGLFNIEPPQPRFMCVWDPNDVIDTLKLPPWSPSKNLNLSELSKKVIFLILITSGQRGQVSTALDLEQMVCSMGKITFKILNKDLKQGRPRYKPNLLELQSFPEKEVCVVNHLQLYLKKTEAIRGDITKVFITSKKPYKPASRDTISRWVKSLLQQTGVSITEFAAGSTRAAASSKASRAGVPLEDILKSGGWSRQSTFTRWYKKDVKKSGALMMAVAVLTGNTEQDQDGQVDWGSLIARSLAETRLRIDGSNAIVTMMLVVLILIIKQ